MKRLSKKRRLYLIRRQRRIERYRLKQRRREKQIRQVSEDAFVVQAPVEFRLFADKPRSRLLSFLQTLRNEVALNHRPVTIDFSDTHRMWSDATLLFRAELCRILRITQRSVPIRCVPPRKNKVSQVLKQVGIYRLLRFRSGVHVASPDVVKWRVANGSGVEGQKYDEILGKYDGVIPPALAEGLYRGLTEAMTNCHHHAYLWQRPDGLNAPDDDKDWWMFSQERDGHLSVVFCDLGVGIPATVPKTKPSLWTRIVTKLGSPNDGDVIREAIEDSKTRTGKHYRGKGLRQLTEAIEKKPGSNLYIYSNNGCYNYKSDGSASIKNFGDSILGTLIQWRVPIETGDSTYEHEKVYSFSS